VRALLHDEPPMINGDGETSRDFCYVANAVQANLLAATTADAAAVNQIYNVALNQRTTLNELFELLRAELALPMPSVARMHPVHGEFRAGDVRHSQADIGKARNLLGYAPEHALVDGLREAMPWYVARFDALDAGDTRVAAGR
jgi:UDP-N-acetylglucosamine 4-epimerase